MEPDNIVITTFMYVVGVQTSIMILMGKYILKLVDDCSKERKEAWGAVNDLTTAVSSLNSELSMQAALFEERHKRLRRGDS